MVLRGWQNLAAVNKTKQLYDVSMFPKPAELIKVFLPIFFEVMKPSNASLFCVARLKAITKYDLAIVTHLPKQYN